MAYDGLFSKGKILKVAAKLILKRKLMLAPLEIISQDGQYM